MTTAVATYTDRHRHSLPTQAVAPLLLSHSPLCCASSRLGLSWLRVEVSEVGLLSVVWVMLSRGDGRRSWLRLPPLLLSSSVAAAAASVAALRLPASVRLVTPLVARAVLGRPAVVAGLDPPLASVVSSPVPVPVALPLPVPIASASVVLPARLVPAVSSTSVLSVSVARAGAAAAASAAPAAAVLGGGAARADAARSAITGWVRLRRIGSGAVGRRVRRRPARLRNVGRAMSGDMSWHSTDMAGHGGGRVGRGRAAWRRAGVSPLHVLARRLVADLHSHWLASDLRSVQRPDRVIRIARVGVLDELKGSRSSRQQPQATKETEKRRETRDEPQRSSASGGSDGSSRRQRTRQRRRQRQTAAMQRRGAGGS